MKLVNDQKKLSKLLIIIVAFQIILAIFGAFQNYSFALFRDMWDGYLGFYNILSSGDLNAWWAQHNEHRIVLSKALFWIDITYFNGDFIFLLICNYIFAALSLLLFWLCLNETLEKNQNIYTRNIIFCLITIFTFSWAQQENFIRGFQTQFFLAQLIPLAAFYFLHLAKAHEILDASASRMTGGGNGLFFLACLCGILSIGTMANGILTLPLMLLLAFFLRLNIWRLLTLAFLSLSLIALYFYHYSSIGDHGSLSDALLHHPIDLFFYILVYFGGPIYTITGKGSTVAAGIIGLFFVASFALFLYNFYKSKSRNSLQFSLLIFILYLGASALGTACGRLPFGIQSAAIGRYATPVLMAWSVLIILYAKNIALDLEEKKSKFLTAILLIFIAFFGLQFKTLRQKDKKIFEQKVAMLAAELAIEDKEQISFIHPSASSVLEIAATSKEKNISAFGNPLIKDVSKLIGTPEVVDNENKFLGNIDKITVISGEHSFVAIEGNSQSSAKIIHIVDKNNIIVGYALSNQDKGFKGYLLANKINDSLELIGIDNDK
jgi:hypothetical protein